MNIEQFIRTNSKEIKIRYTQIDMPIEILADMVYEQFFYKLDTKDEPSWILPTDEDSKRDEIISVGFNNAKFSPDGSSDIINIDLNGLGYANEIIEELLLRHPDWFPLNRRAKQAEE